MDFKETPLKIKKKTNLIAYRIDKYGIIYFFVFLIFIEGNDTNNQIHKQTS